MARVQLPDDIDQVIAGGLTAVNGTARFLDTDSGLPVAIYTGRVNGTSTPTGVATVTNGKAVGWTDSGPHLQYYVTPSGSTEQGPFYWESSSSEPDTVGIDAARNANTRLRIGSGTGSLTDKPYMGLKVKIDSDATHTPAGIQNNVNIVDGTPVGSVHGVVSRVDVNDTHSGVTGDTVALWGDVFVRASSGRPVWGINSYTQIVSGVTYSGAAIGAELGVFNDGTSANAGGALHLVSRGVQTVQFGLLIGEGSGSVHQAKHGILIKDSTTGPTTNAIYFGALDAGNEPSGNARFKVDASGLVTAGGATAAGSSAVYQVLASGEANPRMTINADGSISLGSGAAAAVVALRRPGANQVGTGTNQAWVLGTAAAGGTVYTQSFKQTASPSNPPTDGIREFWRLNGSSKIEKVIRKSDGTELVTYTEP